MTCHIARRVGEFERRLRHDRLALWRAFHAADEELGGLEPHHPGEFMDDAATEATRRVLSSLEERERLGLAEIEAAEARLATQTFGVCEACAQRIPFSRLRALPATRLCVTCEILAEQVTAARG